MAWTGCKDGRLWLSFDSQWTCDGKNSSEFEHAVDVMHGSSPWMLGEENGFSGDLTGRSSRQQSDGCARAVRSGSGGNLSSDESEFLRKRNLKEGREWM
jgi:hypothetical protein